MVVLDVGDEAPDFELQDGSGTTWKLRDLRGERVVLYFYPADDTPGCTTQACDFRDSLTEFTSAGYRVFGVSPQGAASHERFTAKYGLNFPLLIDPDRRVARAYGAVKDEASDGIFKIKRSTFVIDADGRIKSAQYGVTAKGHVAALKEELAI